MERCDEGAVLELLDETKSLLIADFFKTLGDPTRVKILFLLKDNMICVQHLASELNMTSSAISHQLKTLRQQGLVKFKKIGKKVYYELNDDHVNEIMNIVNTHLDE